MCYQTVLTKRPEAIVRHLHTPFIEEDAYEPYYFQNGFEHQNIYIIPQNEPDHIYPATWGLVPKYKLSDPGEFFKARNFNTLNARGESIFETKTYKPHTHQRCLIYSDGFFEPHYYDKAMKKQQPYFCYIPDSKEPDGRKLFCFAGLFSTDGPGSYYVTQLTVEANDFFSEIHNKKKRMPLVLDDTLVKDWLREDLSEPHIKELINIGFTSEDFDAYPVKNIYKRGFDKNTPEILEPVERLG